VNIKFCYKLGKTVTETHGMSVQVYGKKAVSRKRVYDWFKRFRDGKETTEDEPRSGRPLADPNVAHPHPQTHHVCTEKADLYIQNDHIISLFTPLQATTKKQYLGDRFKGQLSLMMV
jgi:transposase